ncbi:MAG: VIT1/CCC1 transporter family protein [Halobacteriales archaeon]|nr:VIT1/CCC1 transporter family protein [Halobacteriales archaeon]
MQATASDGKTLPELKAEHQVAPRGRLDAPGEESEQSPYRNYVRDLILGLNDGIVSVYALVAGLAGAAALFSPRQVGVAGIAAAIAGALSMGLGEYLSTKSQAQYYAAEARREREHIRTYPDLEKAELREMLEEQNYPPELRKPMIHHIAGSEDRFVEFMMREEFGVGKESGRSPVAAMLLIMAAFLVGAALPVLPFLAAPASHPLWAASALSILGLLGAGAAKGKISGLSPLRSGIEMVVFGAVAGLVTYGVGRLIPGTG